MSFPRCVLNGVVADSTGTRFIRILPGGTPEKILTLTSAHTLDTILTFPDTAGVGDTIVLEDHVQTITNKNITDVSNIVHANALKTTGAAVNVNSAAPPTAGQVLQATSATNAAWQTIVAGDVIGPASATDNALARYDGITGKLVQNSGIILGDDNILVLPAGSAVVKLSTVPFINTNDTNCRYGLNAGVSMTDVAANKNTVLGNEAGFQLTTGANNTLVGYQAGYGPANTPSNTAIGHQAMFTIPTTLDGRNVAIGFQTAYLGARNSVVIGADAGKSGIQDRTVVIGSNACKLATGNVSQNVIIGNDAMSATTASFSNVVAIGHSILDKCTNPIQTTAVGAQIQFQSAAMSRSNCFFGHRILFSTLAFSDQNVVMGANALYRVTSEITNNTIIGFTALGDAVNCGDNNIVIGASAGSAQTTGPAIANNIWIGTPGVSGESNTTRIGNTQTKFYAAGIRGVTPTSPQMVTIGTDGQLGSQAVAAGDVVGPASSIDNAIVRFNGTTGKLVRSSTVTIDSSGNFGFSSTIIMRFASTQFLRVGDGNNVFFGLRAGAVVFGSGNTLIGDRAGLLQGGGNSNVFVGWNAGAASILGGSQVFVGASAGGTSGSSGNDCVGIGTLALAVTSNFSVAVGSSALRNGSTNAIAIGYQAGLGSGINKPNNSVLIGQLVANRANTSKDSVIIGNSAVNLHTGDFQSSVIVGPSILSAASTTTASKNTLVGAFQLSTSAGAITENALVGAGTLVNATTGVIIGNAMLGTECLLAATAHGGINRNTLLGGRVLFNKTTISTTPIEDNIIIGYDAGSANTDSGSTCSNNIWIGSPGAASESATIRIGSSQSKCYAAGIRGVITGAVDAIAVVIDSNGQLGTASSSINYKTDVEDIKDTDVIYRLRPVSFKYKEHVDERKKSIGLIAEEVEEVYPDMVIYQDRKILTVDYARLSILLLAEVQKLRSELNDVIASLG